jgi:hypothetical protein
MWSRERLIKPGLSALVMVLVFAACGLEPEQLGPEDWTRPPDQPGPVELVGVMTEAIHVGDSGVWVVPDNEAGDPPAFCITYLDGQTREVESCTVDPEGFVPWGDEVWPWSARGWWIGLNVWDEPVEIHAFDDRGRPLAYWTGRMHEHAGHLTE